MSYPNNYNQVTDIPKVYTEKLTSDDIPSCEAANSNFGEESSLVLAWPSEICRSCSPFWFTVPEGFYALVSRHGSQQDYIDSNRNISCVWPPGVHFGMPCRKVSHLVTKQAMVLHIPVKKCKTKDNVNVKIDTSIVFRVMGDKDKGENPTNVYKFVHYVTTRGLEHQMIDAQVETIRTLTRSVNHTEVLGLQNTNSKELSDFISTSTTLESSAIAMPLLPVDQSGASQPVRIGNEEEKLLVSNDYEDSQTEEKFNTATDISIRTLMKERLNRQFMSQGVEILDVIIQKITLPDAILQQMTQKVITISNCLERQMQRRCDMLILLQGEEINTLQQTIDEEKLEKNKDNDFECLKESMELAHEQAAGSDNLAKISFQMTMDVAMIAAENGATIQRIGDTTKLEVEQVKEETKLDVGIARVDAIEEMKYIEAKADAVSALNESQGKKVLYRAEGVSAPKNKKLNEYLTSMRKIKAQEALANNDKLVVTGTSGGLAANKMLLADAVLRNTKKRPKFTSERSNILSELALASGNSEICFKIEN